MKAKANSDVRARRKALRLSGVIARDIGMQIVSGRYKPGDLLNTEVEASLRLQVSRTTYREAMCMLSAKGLLEMRQHAGTRVTPMECWHWLDPELLVWRFELERGNQSMSSIFELRRAVEPDVAALAAKRRTAEHLMDMRRALSQIQTSSPVQATTLLPEREFRLALFRASHNVFLDALGRTMDNVESINSNRRAVTPSRTPADITRYADLYHAVAVRDSSGARQAMSALIDPDAHAPAGLRAG